MVSQIGSSFFTAPAARLLILLQHCPTKPWALPNQITFFQTSHKDRLVLSAEKSGSWLVVSCGWHAERSPSHKPSSSWLAWSSPSQRNLHPELSWQLSFHQLTLISSLKTCSLIPWEEHACFLRAPRRLKRAPEQFIIAPAFGLLISLSHNSSYLVDSMTIARCVQPRHFSHGSVGGDTAMLVRNPLYATEAI